MGYARCRGWASGLPYQGGESSKIPQRARGKAWVEATIRARRRCPVPERRAHSGGRPARPDEPCHRVEARRRGKRLHAGTIVGGGSGGRRGVASGVQSETWTPGARTRSPRPGGRWRSLRRALGGRACGVAGTGRDLRRGGPGALRALELRARAGAEAVGPGLRQAKYTGLALARALALAPCLARASPPHGLGGQHAQPPACCPWGVRASRQCRRAWIDPTRGPVRLSRPLAEDDKLLAWRLSTQT